MKKRAMRIKQLITICMITMMLFLLGGCSGCGDSPEQKAINEQNIARAKENAVNYIKEKYGFDAPVQDAILIRSYGMFSSTPTSKVLVKMKYNNNDFNVYIDGETSNTDGHDDYQKNIINNAVKELVEKTIPGVERVIVSGGIMNNIEYDPVEECCDVLYTKYFDGSNLREVFEDNDYYIYISYINKDLSSIVNADIPGLLWSDEDRKDVEVNIISYRDRNAYEQCYEWSVDCQYAVYIKEYCKLEGTTKREYEVYKLNKSGDVYYYVEDGMEDYVEVDKLLKTINASDWTGHGVENAKVVSDAYSIASSKDIGSSTVHIYYPISKIKEYSEKDIEYAYCKYANDKHQYSSSTIKNSIIGEYVHRDCAPVDKNAGESYYFVFLKDE